LHFTFFLHFQKLWFPRRVFSFFLHCQKLQFASRSFTFFTFSKIAICQTILTTCFTSFQHVFTFLILVRIYMFSFLYTCVHVFHVQKLWLPVAFLGIFYSFKNCDLPVTFVYMFFAFWKFESYTCVSLCFSKKVNPKKLHFCSPWKMQNQKVTFLVSLSFPKKDVNWKSYVLFFAGCDFTFLNVMFLIFSYFSIIW
jgi:hypothetical protein